MDCPINYLRAFINSLSLLKQSAILTESSADSDKSSGGTCEHHNVLDVRSNLVLAAQVKQEGQRIDVGCPAKEHCQLQQVTEGSRKQHSPVHWVMMHI